MKYTHKSRVKSTKFKQHWYIVAMNQAANGLYNVLMIEYGYTAPKTREGAKRGWKLSRVQMEAKTIEAICIAEKGEINATVGSDILRNMVSLYQSFDGETPLTFVLPFAQKETFLSLAKDTVIGNTAWIVNDRGDKENYCVSLISIKELPYHDYIFYMA